MCSCDWSSDVCSSDLFVGQNDPGPFGTALTRAINKSSTSEKIEITGFTTSERFETYLAAADFAVQLRLNSRGETSKAVVDCLAYGVPVILNANGSMADYPADTVCRLPDDFDDQALTNALELLARNNAERERLAERGLLRVRTYHDPKTVAQQYKAAIEAFSDTAKTNTYWHLLDEVAALDASGNTSAHIEASVSIAKNICLI